MKKCSNCKFELDEMFFYGRKRADGKYKADGKCKFCLGVKNPYKRSKKKPIYKDEPEPSSRELNDFIIEMKRKNAQFSFVDCLRLVDLFVRKEGVIFTTLTMEDELLWMWETLKNKNLKYEITRDKARDYKKS